MLLTVFLFSGTSLNKEEGRKTLIIIFLFLRYLVESGEKGSRICFQSQTILSPNVGMLSLSHCPGGAKTDPLRTHRFTFYKWLDISTTVLKATVFVPFSLSVTVNFWDSYSSSLVLVLEGEFLKLDLNDVRHWQIMTISFQHRVT